MTTLISEQVSAPHRPNLGGSFAVYNSAVYNFAHATGLAAGPLLTGFGVQKAGFASALVITAAVLTALGIAALPRLSSRVRSTVTAGHG